MLTSQPCAGESGPLECPKRFLLASLQPPRGIHIQKFGSTVFDLRILVSAQLSVPQSFYLQNGHSDPLNCFPFKISEGREDDWASLLKGPQMQSGVHLCPGPALSKPKLKPKQDPESFQACRGGHSSKDLTALQGSQALQQGTDRLEPSSLYLQYLFLPRIPRRTSVHSSRTPEPWEAMVYSLCQFLTTQWLLQDPSWLQDLALSSAWALFPGPGSFQLSRGQPAHYLHTAQTRGNLLQAWPFLRHLARGPGTLEPIVMALSSPPVGWVLPLLSGSWQTAQLEKLSLGTRATISSQPQMARGP